MMAEPPKNRLSLEVFCCACCAVLLLVGGCSAGTTAPGVRGEAADFLATPAAPVPPPRPALELPPAPRERSEEELWRAAKARAAAFEPLFREDLANVQAAGLPAAAAPVAATQPRRERPAVPAARPTAAPAASGVPAAGIPNVAVVARYTTQDGLPSNRITAIFADDEDVWVGTADAGLARYNLAEENWLVVQVADGLASDRVSDVAGFRDRIYVGTQQGISVWDGASWVTLETEGRTRLLNTIFRVHGGRLYVAARTMHGGFLAFDGENWNDLSGIRSGSILNNIADFRFGGDVLWIGTTNRGVYRLAGSEWQTYTVADGIASNFVYTLGVLGTTCYLGGCCGLSVLEEGGWHIYDIGEGLPHSTVNTIRVDGNVVWLGSKKGLAVFDGLEFMNLHVADGLTDEHITAVFVRGNQVWVGTANGLNRLEKSY